MKTQWGVNIWYKSFIVLFSFMSHLLIFPSDWRTGFQCLWASAFSIWLIFQIWNALVETIFTLGNFPVSEMDLPSREKVVVSAQVPTCACQESGFGVNFYDERVFQGGSLVHVLCSVVSWRLWERCQRARLCGGGKGRTEYDRQLLQWADHEELGGEHSRG